MYPKIMHVDTLWKNKKKNATMMSTSMRSTWKTDVHLYKGAFEKRKMSTPKIEKIYDSETDGKKASVLHINKVIVFDLDETLGSFSDLYSLWNILKLHYVFLSKSDGYVDLSLKYLNGKEDELKEEKEKVWYIKQKIFNQLLDLYPEFLRYGILSILKFVHKKILAGECKNIYIYTNNQCIFPEWITLIISYLNYNLGESATIFEKPVCAFKINNHVVENNRTSTEKTYSDFIKCTLLPKNTEICFVDDREYDRMKNDKIYYIQPPPYFHNLSKNEIIDRFFNSNLYLLSLTNARITASSVLSIGFSKHDASQQEAISLREIIEKHYDVYGNWEKHADMMGFNINLNEPSPATAIATHNHEIYLKMFYYIREFFAVSGIKLKTKRRRHAALPNKKTRRNTQKPYSLD